MKNKHIFNLSRFLLSITIPTALSAVAIHHASVVLLIITILGMFLMLKIPVFKHRENLWMFVISTFATIPININLVRKASKSAIFDYNNITTSVFCGFVIYSILFAVEQIILGLTTRLFYGRQYKLFENIETTNYATNVI